MVSVSVTLFQGLSYVTSNDRGWSLGTLLGHHLDLTTFVPKVWRNFWQPRKFSAKSPKKTTKIPKTQEQPVTGTFTILGSQSSPGIVDSKSLSKHIVFAGPNHSITTRWLYKWPFWFPSWRSNCQVVKIYFQGFPLVRSLCCNISRWCLSNSGQDLHPLRFGRWTRGKPTGENTYKWAK